MATTPANMKFRFTEVDKQLLKKVAEARGLNVTELIRRLTQEESVRLAARQK